MLRLYAYSFPQFVLFNEYSQANIDISGDTLNVVFAIHKYKQNKPTGLLFKEFPVVSTMSQFSRLFVISSYF